MKLVVTGTDTDVGKTIFAAGLAGAIGAHYWKPIQAGLDPPTDRERVTELSGLPSANILPERHRLKTPASVHRAAEIDNVLIEPALLELPDHEHLVVEGAGGALVPLTRYVSMADLFAHWNVPVIVVARTALGTINHSLLTLEALRTRGCMVHGIAFVGAANEDTEQTICQLGLVRRLGRLPHIERLTPTSLAIAFAVNFRAEDFR